MATYQEMHRIAHDPAAVRDLAKRLLKIPNHEWTHWELDFLENMAKRQAPDPISMRQREVLLELRDETEHHSRIDRISVKTLIVKCYEYRFDLDESDADWIVKLIDVYPEKYPENWKLSGYELMIADEVFRGRFRNSFEKPEPIQPGAVTPFKIDLHTANHMFKKGHRIMIQVQSTWFPVIDRNPQKFVPNIFEAKESDYQKATHRIYRSKQFPSSLEISVLAANPGPQ